MNWWHALAGFGIGVTLALVVLFVLAKLVADSLK